MNKEELITKSKEMTSELLQWIGEAEEGDGESELRLRLLMASGAKSAPVEDIVIISQCIYNLAMDSISKMEDEE